MYIHADAAKLWDFYLAAANVRSMSEQECESLSELLDTMEMQLSDDITESYSEMERLRSEIGSAGDEESTDPEKNSQLLGKVAELENHVRELEELRALINSYRSELDRKEDELKTSFRKGLNMLEQYMEALESVSGGSAAGRENRSDRSDVKSGSFHKMSFRGRTFYADDSSFDINHIDVKGRSNLRRMEKGMAPIGKDGLPINLHHMQQSDQIGGMMEVTSTMHSKNHNMLHINSGSGLPSGINRRSFSVMRRAYWKNRAASFKAQG